MLPGGTSQVAGDCLPCHAAGVLLSQLPHLRVRRLGERQLEVPYDFADHSLEDLESLLSQQGLHLEGSLLIPVKCALIYHVERMQRENLGKPEVKTKNHQPHTRV